VAVAKPSCKALDRRADKDDRDEEEDTDNADIRGILEEVVVGRIAVVAAAPSFPWSPAVGGASDDGGDDADRAACRTFLAAEDTCTDAKEEEFPSLTFSCSSWEEVPSLSTCLSEQQSLSE